MDGGTRAEPASCPAFFPVLSCPVLVETLMDSTLQRWNGHVLRPVGQPRTDLTHCTHWCDLSLFSSELGLFSENTRKTFSEGSNSQCPTPLGPCSPKYLCERGENRAEKGKAGPARSKPGLVTQGMPALQGIPAPSENESVPC